MISTTTTTRRFEKNSSVEWLKKGLVVLVLLHSIRTMAQDPELFLPGQVSTIFKERDMTISKDGNHLLFSMHDYKDGVRMIVEMKRTSGKWSSPKVVSFSGVYKDLEPMFDPSQDRLFFASDRPLEKGDESGDFNIWYVPKDNSGWGRPVPMNSTINGPGDEYYPSISNNGNLYFTATRSDSKGKEDIYMSRWQDGKYQKSLSLDSAINSSTYEFNAFIDPAEQYLLFSSYGRTDGFGGGDLYLSLKGKDGLWQPAIHLSQGINSSQLDYCPFVSADGRTMYFTSNRYRSEAIQSVESLISQMENFQNGFDNIYSIPMSEIKEMSVFEK
ncbi:MAG: hypothetical protein ABJF11_15520 [Reichenbachiella sp.]|uniref:TolB family protein n=1 Tax=Reichenbachiella sp. TaxID=2184521 RepID=UPI0032660747